jgi:hypothetical protein
MWPKFRKLVADQIHKECCYLSVKNMLLIGVSSSNSNFAAVSLFTVWNFVPQTWILLILQHSFWSFNLGKLQKKRPNCQTSLGVRVASFKALVIIEMHVNWVTFFWAKRKLAFFLQNCVQGFCQRRLFLTGHFAATFSRSISAQFLKISAHAFKPTH